MRPMAETPFCCMEITRMSGFSDGVRSLRLQWCRWAIQLVNAEYCAIAKHLF